MAKKLKINNNIFIGNNELGSENLFYSRLAYSTYAFHKHPDAVESGVVKDFWFMENSYYGKVNLGFVPLQVDRDALVPLANHENQFTLPFVRDAFEDFEKDVRKCVLEGNIRSFPLLRRLQVVESTKNFPRMVSQRLTSFVGYLLRQLTNSGKIDDVESFKDFMIQFEDICLQYAEKAPLTKSSLVMTKRVDVRYTGLALSLAEEDYSTDRAKVKFYINHPEYPYYLKLLEKYGFYADKNAPWRIIANVSSAAMQLYLKEGGADPGLNPIFSRYYKRAYSGDLALLRYAAFAAYGTLLVSRPKIFKTVTKDGKLVTTVKQRAKLDQRTAVGVYPPQRWLALYVRIKNKEKNVDLSENRINEIVSNSINLTNLLDMGPVLGYIDRVFKDIPSLEGSYNDFRNRMFYRKIDEDEYPFSDYQTYLRNTLKKS